MTIEDGLAEAKRRARADWDRGEALLRAGDAAAALPWLERAHRLAPSDQNLRFSVAMARLRAGDAAGAAALFAPMAERFGVREAWTGLALAWRMLGREAEATAALERALSGSAVDAAMAGLAEVLAPAGWCGVDAEGRVQGAPAKAVLRYDGVASAEREVPAGAGVLTAEWQGRPLLGSPVDVAGLRRCEGMVWLEGGEVRGWAWHPASPDRDPVLTVTRGGAVETLRAVARGVEVEGSTPLARPRGFAAAVPAGRGPVRVRDETGRELWGSPVHPGAEARRMRARARPAADGRPPLVVIPVYRGFAATMACLNSVLGSLGDATLVVVDDAGPEPALAAALAARAGRDGFRLIRLRENRGFPGAANAGLALAEGRDAILLNADTLVPPGWIGRLRAAAHASPEVGTATPLSNDATILSYPDPRAPGAAPDLAGTVALDRMARAANGAAIVDIPTGHGFCLYLRGDCLAQVGLLREDLFAQGYGEENDFCERARALGWRHVAVPGVFVAHVGGVSFGAGRMALIRRNLAVLNRVHPGYDARIARFVAGDALARYRARIDAQRWVAGRGAGGAVLVITHGGRGGVNRIVAERCAAIRAEGRRPVVLRGREGVSLLGEEDEAAFPNLRFRLPGEAAGLLRLLRGEGVARVEMHHRLGHDPSVAGLAGRLGVPTEMWVHDHAGLCPRIAFVTGEGRYCGEPEAAVCDACVARWGRTIDEPIDTARLRARTAREMREASLVVAPSEDTVRRLRAWAPAAAITRVPWEAEDWPPIEVAPLRGGRVRVAVVGAIGIDKGFEVLRGCAEDAAARDLPITFRLVGFSADDAALMRTDRLFVTGEFRREEAEGLIRAQGAQLAFLPSIWPETWCFALSDCWRAGLATAVFDIGAPAERVRATGRGWVLPLALPPERVNEVLLDLATQLGVEHGRADSV